MFLDGKKEMPCPAVAYEYVTTRVANALGLPCFTVSKVLNKTSSGMFCAFLQVFTANSNMTEIVGHCGALLMSFYV